MVTVILYGDLAADGRRFTLDVGSAAEALRALIYQINGFKKKLLAGRFFVRIAKKNASMDTIQKDMQNELSDGDTIHIVPEIAGAGKNGGIFQIIVGVAMVVAAFYTGGATLSYWGAMQAGMATMGASMIFGGVAQLMTKTPSFDTEGGESKTSSAFSNLQNSTAQGSCVPYAAGRLRIGSKTISQSLETYDVTGEGNADAEELTTTRTYFTPVEVAGYSLDKTNDSVIARNYTAKEA